MLILAKSKKAASTLSQQFEKRQISKEYLAIVMSGNGQDGTSKLRDQQGGFIDARLKVTDTDVQLCKPCWLLIVRIAYTMLPGRPDDKDAACKDARTRWQHITSGGVYLLLKLYPETGRKHQIRVHCSKVLGAPVVGDFKYGYLGPQIAGHLLHCHSISFYVGCGGEDSILRSSSPQFCTGMGCGWQTQDYRSNSTRTA